MDSSPPENNAQPDERIASLINEYFDRKQAGEELTPESFAAEHPDVAEALRPYLNGVSLLDRIRSSAQGVPAAEEATPAAMQLPGLEGYKLIEEIGRGGMGVVYKALQISTKRAVALKVMLVGPFASQSALRRFDREVELAARLQHPGIVRVLESGQAAEQKYYAMDFVEGVRLDSYLASAQPDVRATLGMFRHVCEAADYAHRHGVIHRDLKPGNVLIDDEGNPRILDFGLAKATDEPDTVGAAADRVSTPGQVMGTLHYLSPEQAAGIPERIDARTDVYALGLLLCEALTGSLPFDTTGKPSEVIRRILEAPPTLPSSLSKRVDSELDTIILKALEKDSARRYQSAGEMGDDIRRYLEGEPILARRPSSIYFLRKKLRKHRLGAALGTAVVVLTLISVAAGIRWKQRDLARGHRELLAALQALEGGVNPGVLRGKADTLYRRWRGLPEAALVCAHAEYLEYDLAASILFLERELEANPSHWACRGLLAEMHRAAGNAEPADALQAQAEHEAPDTAEGWYLRSFATLDLGTALQCAREAAKRQPSHALAWDRIRFLCKETGELDGALQAAAKLIELGLDSASGVTFMADILAEQGRVREAVEEYTKAVRLQGVGGGPRAAAVYLRRGQAYRRLREYDKAAVDYDRAVELDGRRNVEPWFLYQRATVLWIVGRLDDAQDDYRRFREMFGRPFFADARRFFILRELGRDGQAKEVLAAALRDVGDPWHRLVFQCLNGQITADQLIIAAWDNMPTGSSRPERVCEAYYYAGEVCLLSGQLTEARKWFEECVQTGVEFDPDANVSLTPMSEYELAQWRLNSIFAGIPTSKSNKN